MTIGELLKNPEFKKLDKECGDLHRQLEDKLKEVYDKFNDGGKFTFCMNAANTILVRRAEFLERD